MSSSTVSGSKEISNQNAVFISRRSVILTVVGATPTENSTLAAVLQNDYLGVVKQWMDDILRGTVGGIDLLLHLLTNIAQLPVTKGIVKESGMGKAIGSIEKHRICVDSPNKVAIVERVNAIKEAWKVSVKVRKDKTLSSSSTPLALKRDLEASSESSLLRAKKPKLDDTKKSSLSSLLTKVAPSSILSTDDKHGVANVDSSKKVGSILAKKTGKRLKWKDHFGGTLEASKILEDDHTLRDENPDEDISGFGDRKSRDRNRERELLAKAKKAKLSDDDDEGLVLTDVNLSIQVQPTIAWNIPPSLPERSDATCNNSKEKLAQTTRMATVTPVEYSSEYNVPMNPAPLSDVEQALDMTSQSSTVTQIIPFFVLQQPIAPDLAPKVIPTSTPAYSPLLAQPPSGIANVETVQSLGLPPFLAGQNLQSLRTLANTPELLRSFVDSNGMYDQIRLMNLVETLSQNSPSSSQQHQGEKTGFQQQKAIGQNTSASGLYGQASGHGGMYGMPSNENKYGGQSAYGSNNNWQGNGMKTGGYRGAQNSSEGNLHLSGYGPGTTQSEIIALFSPYVQVSEVVMKATFCFVNTNDPAGAKQAREALNGALLGGQPVRINMAQRKNRDNNMQQNGVSNTGSYYGRNTGMQASNTGYSGMTNSGFVQPPPPPMGISPSQTGSDVRDDRGNPATKNLFVAGYGQGTSENQLREIFSAYAQISGIISKGTFSFVNTTDKNAAIHAREVLSGTMVNGGVLRINFAKETGRLGTSFDLTYGGVGGQHQNRSHYGR